MVGGSVQVCNFYMLSHIKSMQKCNEEKERRCSEEEGQQFQEVEAHLDLTDQDQVRPS